jgi:Cys-rich protein (TIGR01571 family)
MKLLVIAVSLVFLRGSNAARRQGGVSLRAGRQQEGSIANTDDFMATNVIKAGIGSITAVADADMPMPTVSHKKDAGDGYSASSPLYEKQEAIKRFMETAKADEEVTTSTLIETATRHWAFALSSTLIYIILVLIVAALYRKHKPESRQAEFEPAEGGSFTFGILECANLKQDWLHICLLSCCCPAIRWADTISAVKVGIMPFWPALILALSLFLLGPITAGLTTAAFSLIAIFVRQRLRLYFEHEPNKPTTLVLDCFAWCCCFQCCALIQEAREVEYVQRKQ